MTTAAHSDLSSVTDHPGALQNDMVRQFDAMFRTDRAARIAQNAVTQTTLDDVAMDRSILNSIDASFSHKLDDWKVTNQKKTGRCWMFAALNLFRVSAMKTMKLKDFEFSQNWTLFWDKFERANWFLEAMINLADRPADDRTVAFLVSGPIDDGGQWNMFVNLVKRHGLVPKTVMPETASSSATRSLNRILVHLLRQGAKTLRDMHASGTSIDGLRDAKEDILAAVHRVLCIHLGSPPVEFEWQWNDDEGNFHRDGTMTPQQFAQKYVDIELDDYVCLVHDPRPTSPFGRTFTVQHLGNVVGGAPVVYLNIELPLMKQIASKVIQGGEPVWFGCDVGPQMRRDLGMWHAHLFDYEGVHGIDFTMSKADRLEYGQTAMTHAMLFTGVDMVDGNPRRWRVENSWGEDSGRKGFYTMNDSWFDEYMFEIAAHKKHLPLELASALGDDPIELAPWDPMGALARSS